MRLVEACRNLIVFTNSLMRCAAPPSREFTFAAGLARRVQMSGRETAVSPHSPPSVYWRFRVSYDVKEFRRDAHNCGEVGIIWCLPRKLPGRRNGTILFLVHFHTDMRGHASL